MKATEFFIIRLVLDCLGSLNVTKRYEKITLFWINNLILKSYLKAIYLYSKNKTKIRLPKMLSGCGH